VQGTFTKIPGFFTLFFFISLLDRVLRRFSLPPGYVARVQRCRLVNSETTAPYHHSTVRTRIKGVKLPEGALLELYHFPRTRQELNKIITHRAFNPSQPALQLWSNLLPAWCEHTAYKNPVVVCHVPPDQDLNCIRRYPSEYKCPDEDMPNNEYQIDCPWLVKPVAVLDDYFIMKLSSKVDTNLKSYGLNHDMNRTETPLEPFYDKRDIIFPELKQ
jgi:hypothetical protein